MPTPGFEVLPPTGPPRPAVVHVPHAGTRIPSEVRPGLLLDDAALAGELARMTDHRTDVLAAGTGAVGATRFVNRCSRLVVDPERFLDPDLEEMEAIGMGAVYTATSHLGQLREPDPAERERLLTRWFHPYQAALTDLVGRQLRESGRCVLVDVHSYPSRALPYERHAEVPRPPLCIGTHPVHTPSAARDTVVALARDAGLDTDLDVPFAGTFVPTAYLGDPRVVSVMLEIRRDTYLDETSLVPHDGETRVTDLVTAVVAALLG